MANIIVLLVLTTFILVSSLFRAKIKGYVGEKTVAAILYLLNSSKYKVINNVVLDTQGTTSQIDHLVISDFGVFVIETKNYKGWIVGSENSEYWTQVLYKRKEKLYNPIRQNAGHIRALKDNLVEFPNVKYISIIVFSSKSEIKVNTDKEVTYPYRLLRVIRKYSDVSLSEFEKEKIYQKISSINLRDKYEKSQHINSIKQRIQKRKNSIAENKCPRCGDKLIFRQGRFGNFFGCRSFPICKFTKNNN